MPDDQQQCKVCEVIKGSLPPRVPDIEQSRPQKKDADAGVRRDQEAPARTGDVVKEQDMATTDAVRRGFKKCPQCNETQRSNRVDTCHACGHTFELKKKGKKAAGSTAAAKKKPPVSRQRTIGSERGAGTKAATPAAGADRAGDRSLDEVMQEIKTLAGAGAKKELADRLAGPLAKVADAIFDAQEAYDEIAGILA